MDRSTLAGTALTRKMQPVSAGNGPTIRKGTSLNATAQNAEKENTGQQRCANADLADVERVLAGEVNAFERIVRRWQGPLINMAWRYCRDRGRAEEMAQEALVRAWRGLKQWRREGSFSTWLFALAANVFRSELKHFPTGYVAIDDAPEPARGAGQESGLAVRQSEDAVRRAVLALPMRYREPVILFYFHEMDVEAAARTMGMPEGTLKARLARARAILKERFPHLEDQQTAMNLAEKEA